MKVSVVAVGRPGKLLGSAIAEYERRAARYWNFEAVEVREEKAARRTPEDVRRAETSRLLERVPAHVELVPLTRSGERWSSAELARYLGELTLRARTGVAFLIGGALGLSGEALERADRLLALSAFTLPHELARLVLAEQLYRAGTIVRREPYHKASE